MTRKKKHRPPVCIPLKFEDAVSGLLAVKPKKGPPKKKKPDRK